MQSLESAARNGSEGPPPARRRSPRASGNSGPGRRPCGTPPWSGLVRLVWPRWTTSALGMEQPSTSPPRPLGARASTGPRPRRAGNTSRRSPSGCRNPRAAWRRAGAGDGRQPARARSGKLLVFPMHFIAPPGRGPASQPAQRHQGGHGRDLAAPRSALFGAVGVQHPAADDAGRGPAFQSRLPVRRCNPAAGRRRGWRNTSTSPVAFAAPRLAAPGEADVAPGRPPAPPANRGRPGSAGPRRPARSSRCRR